ncbi:putative monocarboxylate permease [Aspergillus ellipticus CBS 707.79]|uniref:Putative monocarboxylate permease n=1 Tax=Aspergillus ellipticus CBS 707.79 TaxID=1448320 RepID=A0A319DJQ7_9EURO|nr:putative monocarboxylate permease [Aspergillus ellipticus CBS 707.79]
MASEPHSNDAHQEILARDVSEEKGSDRNVDNDLPEDNFTEGGFPEGGLRAWIVALGNAGVMFCTLGYINSWGDYQASYEKVPLRDENPSAIAWIGSQRRFIWRPTVVYPAALTYIFAIFMTSLCTKLYQFILAQGVLGGLANGECRRPWEQRLPQWFNKKRGAAMGLAIAGSSVGGVILPIVLNQLLNYTNLGFGWSIRLLGFIILGVLPPSCIAIKARLPPRKGKFLLPSAFKEPPYATLVICMFFALSQGWSPTLSFYVVSTFNAASFPGRVPPAILSDRVGRLNMLCVAGVSSGILGLCWQRVHGNAGIIVFTAVFGFCSGAIITGAAIPLASSAKDPRNIGTDMGMGMGVGSIATLIGPPISGALYDSYHGFDQVSIYCGIVCLFGGLLALFVKRLSGHNIMSRA